MVLRTVTLWRKLMASIYKRPNSKTYNVIYDITDANGKRKQIWESGLSYKQAKTRKLEIETQQENGSFADPNKLTLKEYLEQWLVYYKKKGNAFATCSLVENCIYNHIVPSLGTNLLQALTPKEVEDFFLDLKKRRHLQNNRYMKWEEKNIPRLSQNTIRHIYIYFNMALNKAVEWKLLVANPIKVGPPKTETNHRVAWDEETLMEALNEADNPLLHLALHLAFVGSMRAGEISGLTWNCIDWDEESISIEKIVQRVSKRNLEASVNAPLVIFPNAISTRQPESVKSCLILKGPKTASSHRIIYMTTPLKEELLKWKSTVDRRRLILCEEYNDYNLVLCLEDGRPIEPKLIAKWFGKFIERHNGAFPKVTLHSLRSTSTTYKLVLSKGDIKSVQGDTGHANAKMVTDTYAKIQDKNRKKMARALEKNFYPAINNQKKTLIEEQPISEIEAANNLQLLQKLAADPIAMNELLKLLQTI